MTPEEIQTVQEHNVTADAEAATKLTSEELLQRFDYWSREQAYGPMTIEWLEKRQLQHTIHYNETRRRLLKSISTP